jgi:hypothetical protein
MAPVGVLVRDLALQSGQKLYSSAELRNEILLISAKDQPLDRILDEIARATAGTWVRHAGGKELIRSAAGIHQRYLDEVGWRRKIYGADFEKLIEPPVEPHSDDKAKAVLGNPPKGMPHVDWGEPCERLLRILAKRIGFDAIARVQAGERIVYSNFPGPGQRRLPTLLASEIERYRREQTIFDRAAASIDHPYGIDGVVEGYWRDPPAPPVPKVKTVLFVVKGVHGESSDLFDVGISIQVELYDPQGNMVHNASKGFDRRPPQFEKLIPARVPSDDAFDHDDRSDAYFSVFFATPKDPAYHLVTETKMHPETWDPVGFGVNKALFKWADRTNRNIVAVVPDVLLPLLWIAHFTEAWSVEQLLGLLTATMDHWVDGPDGWAALVPNYPVDCMRLRCDRKSLGDLCRALVNKEDPLEAFSNFYFANPFLPDDTMGPDLAGHVASQDWSWVGDLKFARFYGSLGPQQRRQLMTGGNLLVAQLNATQRGELLRFVSDQGGWGEQGVVEPPGVHVPDLLSEATERFRFGVPADAAVTVSQVNTPEMAFIGFMKRWQVCTPDKFCNSMLNKRSYKTLFNSPDVNRSFRAAHKIVYTLSVHLSGGARVSERMTETVMDSPVGIPLLGLPKVILDGIATGCQKWNVAIPGILAWPSIQPDTLIRKE